MPSIEPGADESDRPGTAAGARERPAPALEARRVVKRFGAVTALDGVSLEVPRGRCVALVGESGSGKTTLLRCFNRLVVPDAGEVRVAGRLAQEGDPVELRRRVGYVPQQGGLLPHWTVLRNAALVPRLRGASDGEARRRAAAALARVGLPPEAFGSRWPRSLSGGQRQRVALARALAADPEVVLLDEPFGALDAITRAELQDAFAALLEDGSITALLVTHDLREATRLAHEVAVLRAGRLLRVAAPEALLADPGDRYVAELLHRAGLS
jgi:osmoprotectant transport system ATP-binding protein